MNLLVGAARIFLGSVLLVAGVAKARDRESFRKAVVYFGANSAAIRTAASYAVPTFEIAVGFILITGIAWRAASVAATGALVSFTLAVVVRLVTQGEAKCACFGSLLRSRIGPATLV
ncbi:MAG: hypothetical protein C4317_02775, partial [Acidimicrobiia bacterium]